ncbi:MAG: class E sortase [Acidimicrobiales bacterium]
MDAPTAELPTCPPRRPGGAHLAAVPARRRRTGARLLGGLGRACIAAGLVLLLFVAYQLWGTGLQHSRAQRALGDRLDEQLEALEDRGAPAARVAGTAAAPVPAAPLPAPQRGDPVGRMTIPEIGLDEVIVEGVSTDDLKKGPGHFPGAPLPGQAGNASLAGHRTTYGAPFYRIDELEPGDEIRVTTLQGEFRYRVTETLIVSPDRVDVLDDKGDNRLTLTSCHPRYSARQRIVVVAGLAGSPQSAPTRPASTAGAPPAPAPLDLGDGADLSGADSARSPAVLWGLVTAGVAALVWATGRLWRRLPAYALGLPAVLGALFMFFERVSALLPANL